METSRVLIPIRIERFLFFQRYRICTRYIYNGKNDCTRRHSGGNDSRKLDSRNLYQLNTIFVISCVL